MIEHTNLSIMVLHNIVLIANEIIKLSQKNSFEFN